MDESEREIEKLRLKAREDPWGNVRGDLIDNEALSIANGLDEPDA